MKILNSQQNLSCYLQGIRDRKITIVTAFASGTQSLVEQMLKNGNQVEIIVGSINAFSSPEFINDMRMKDDISFSFWMDFRYEASTHWKLYLVEPNIVILGSANFTNVGVSLTRDTLLVVDDSDIYQQYMAEVSHLKSQTKVMNPENDLFERYYNDYIDKHRRKQSALLTTTEVSDVQAWLMEEANQSIPLFIWEQDITSDDIQTAQDLLNAAEPDFIDSSKFRLSTYACKKNELPYLEGDVAITLSHKGSHARFEKFDRIFYKEGKHYLCSFKYKRKREPFNIKDIAKGLKSEVEYLHEAEATMLSRDTIENFVN